MQVENNWQFVIVHVHMFKNAGSTFDWSLKKNFGDAFIDHRDDDQMRKGAAYLGPYLKKWRPKAISSHHIKLPLPEIEGMTLLPAFILRHPIDRIGSVYNFEKRQKANTKGAIKAKEMTFAEFIRWYMEDSSPATIRDFQTRWCSGNTGTAKPLNQKDYEKALTTLKEAPLLGIVEFYDESMVVFEDYLSKYFPGIDLSYKKQNVGKRQAEGLEDRIFRIKEELGDDLVKLVIEKNQYDFMLYEQAKNILDSRIMSTADFDEKMEGFYAKVGSLQPPFAINNIMGASNS